MLEGFHTPPKFQQCRTSVAVIRLDHVRRHVGIRQAQTRRDLQERPVLEGFIIPAHIRRFSECNVLAVLQNLQLAGFQWQQPLGIRFLPIHVIVNRAAYKTGKHGRNLLAIQLGIVVLIQNKQLGQHRGIVRKTPKLASFHRIDDVKNRLCRHTHLLATYTNLRRITGMAFVKVIGHAPSDAVEVGTPDSVSMPCRMTFPAPITRLSCRGSISDGSIWSWR